MDPHSLTDAVSTFCQLRLRGRRVFSAASDTYISDVPAFLSEWRELSRERGEETCFRVFSSVIENAVNAVDSKEERFLACWMICEAFARRMDELVSLFYECKMLKPGVKALVSSLYVGESDSTLGTQHTSSGDISVLSGGAQHSATPESQHTHTDKSLPPPEAEGARPTLQHSPRTRFEDQKPQKSLSFFVPESQESARLLTFWSQMAARRTYTRGCCVRQLDDCCDLKLLRAAVHQARVRVFFVQRSAGAEMKEFLLREGVFCVDRLGKQVADQFGQKLAWQVCESTSEWLLSSEGNLARRSWKYYSDAKQTGEGPLVTIYPKALAHPLQSTIEAVPATHTALAGDSFPGRAEGGQTRRAARKELLAAWERGFLVQFHQAVSLAQCMGGSKLSASVVVSRILENSTLDAVLDAVCFLCRCQL